ncbi:MAG: SPOR domain-containing protein [Candidatus Omnitrophica bacterium]|jgi:cell division protein FtsN|nr:SPOR domain-containing protein [Candidatus Omnitrophota bacterium]
MEKDYSQLELFSQGKASNQASPRTSRAFITYISKYEKIILIIIGFVITGIASFSLGVEKGKRYAMPRNDSRFDIAVKPAQALPVPAPKQAVIEPQSQPVKKEAAREITLNYTVQVASFTSRVNAQKEVESLRRKGLSPLVLSKGKFSIVCVGNFSKREEAESLLPKLKKQYQDCRIRRL